MLPAKAGPLDLGEEEKRSMDRQASSVSFVISPTRTSDVGPPGPSPVNAAFRQTARSIKQPRKTRSLHDRYQKHPMAMHRQKDGRRQL